MSEVETASKVNVNQQSGVATSLTPEFYDPQVYPPPLGVQMWVMTSGGINIRAVWKNDAGFLAWYPFPKTPGWLRDKLNDSYIGKKKA